MSLLQRILARSDRFTTGILIAVVLGLLLPCQGGAEVAFSWLTQAAIVLLFFLYGVKLSRRSVIKGLLHWRLQLLVFCSTFILFPLLVYGARFALEPLVGTALFMGLLYVACLPSTVQSSIAFTSVAGGNIPAAVCSASASSLMGVFLTPLLVGLLFATSGGSADIGLQTVLNICLQILLPFTLGQCCRKYLVRWVHRRKKLISWNDQMTIWLVIYTSFSEATRADFWSRLDLAGWGGIILASSLILTVVLLITYWASRLLGFSREDRITIVFCGSKKSLAVGAPMMVAIFGGLDNALLLPLMVFHQIQLMACAQLARRWRKQGATTGGY